MRPFPICAATARSAARRRAGGGFAINLGAKADSLTVEGEDAIAVFHAVIDGKESPAERRFCSRCGSALWVSDPRWPDLVHPFASAIDTPLPTNHSDGLPRTIRGRSRRTACMDSSSTDETVNDIMPAT